MRLVKRLGLLLLITLPVYIGSYAALSVKGRYEPAAIGLDHVSAYKWAPRSFVVGYRWKCWPIIIYAPLYLLDTLIWHTDAKVYSRLYPVDEVKCEDVWKLYQAYGFFAAEDQSAGEKRMPPKPSRLGTARH